MKVYLVFEEGYEWNVLLGAKTTLAAAEKLKSEVEKEDKSCIASNLQFSNIVVQEVEVTD